MAGVSTKEIKNRLHSLHSTKAITRAMEMVAAAKLRRAQEKVLSSRPYFKTFEAVLSSIVDGSQASSSEYLNARPIKRSAWIVIAGDRGLAGGYNSNVVQLAWSKIDGIDATVLPIGRKAVDFFRSRNCSLLSGQYAAAEDLSPADCFCIANQLCEQYLDGKFDRLCVAYTIFGSVLTQTPMVQQLLPLPRKEPGAKHVKLDILFEPDRETVLDAIIPEYVGGILYGALCESRAAEQAARRTAMNAATKNASEMIDDLSLQYNRSRQAAITQQITEIIAGP